MKLEDVAAWLSGNEKRMIDRKPTPPAETYYREPERFLGQPTGWSMPTLSTAWRFP